MDPIRKEVPQKIYFLVERGGFGIDIKG